MNNTHKAVRVPFDGKTGTYDMVFTKVNGDYVGITNNLYLKPLAKNLKVLVSDDAVEKFNKLYCRKFKLELVQLADDGLYDFSLTVLGSSLSFNTTVENGTKMSGRAYPTPTGWMVDETGDVVVTSLNMDFGFNQHRSAQSVQNVVTVPTLAKCKPRINNDKFYQTLHLPIIFPDITSDVESRRVQIVTNNCSIPFPLTTVMHGDSAIQIDSLINTCDDGTKELQMDQDMLRIGKMLEHQDDYVAIARTTPITEFASSIASFDNIDQLVEWGNTLVAIYQILVVTREQARILLGRIGGSMTNHQPKRWCTNSYFLIEGVNDV